MLLFIPVFLSAIFEYTIGENILVSQDRYGQDFSEGGVFRSHSLIGNPIDYANYAIIIMSILLPSIILKYKLFFSKKNNYIVFILMFMTLFMANSKGPVLAIILSLMVMSFYLRFLTIRGVVYSLILLVVIGITMGDLLIDRFTNAHFGSDSDYRVLYLIKTIEVFSDYPVFGIGPGMYGGWVSINYSPSYVYDLYDFSTDRISSIDMFFPHLIGELGLLGFFSYMLFFIRPFQYFKNIFKRSDIKEVQFVSLISLLVIPMLFLIGWFSIALENQMIISLYFILIGLSEKFVKNKGKLKDD